MVKICDTNGKVREGLYLRQENDNYIFYDPIKEEELSFAIEPVMNTFSKNVLLSMSSVKVIEKPGEPVLRDIVE